MPCYIEKMKDGGTMILCGKLGPHCAVEKCAAVSGFLCDYPVGNGKRCDLPLCTSHAYEVAPDVHYCPGHLTLWNAFREGGGVKRELENVVPFKGRADVAEAKDSAAETVARTGLGSIRVVSQRKGGTPAAPDELVIDVDRRNAVLGNRHILSNHKDETERTMRIEQFEADFRDDMARRGPMFAAVNAIAAKVSSGTKVALRCWCAPRRCHVGIAAAKVAEITGCALPPDAVEAASPQLSLL